MAEVIRRTLGRVPPPDRTARAFLRTASRFYGRVESALSPIGLSYAQYRLLERLGGTGNDGRGADPSWSGRAVSEADESLRALEREGLVQTHAAADGGAPQVELTPWGESRLLVASERLRGVVAEFTGALGESEAVGLHRLLGKALGARPGVRGPGV